MARTRHPLRQARHRLPRRRPQRRHPLARTLTRHALVANHSAVAAAVLLAGTGVLLAAMRGTRKVIVMLLVGFAASWSVVAGLDALGTTLANVQSAQQPQSLSSMFYAMTGTSAALTSVPCILLAGAMIAFLVTRLPRDRQSKPALAR